ncbi:sensor domain CHASE3-containing protein [Devosia enhydra]|uniref:histidine kinase n=1 Tax=Devosia enhydra TaxID=665118 RepID=A0A1K2HWK7_9HYPH|nr:ATP-binding protein [Devosia enhydra]SFZ82454.1 sensor domain CHASE3-containing protein [Devosia enhydra]
MPVTSRTFIRSTILLLIGGLVALLAIVGTTIWLGERSQSFFDEVIEAREARVAAVGLRYSLTQAEGGQRGFLITGQDVYLEPYTAAVAQLPAQIAALESILVPYPQATEPMARLKDAIAAKQREMEETIALRRAGREAEAQALVANDVGRQLMEESLFFLGAIIDAADERLTTGVSDQRANANAQRLVNIIGGLIIILVVGGAALLVVRYTRELTQARDEVRTLNTELEGRVNERTADLARANEEIQRFAYIVTHDLRAPLVNIMGFTSELEESVKNVRAVIERAGGDDPEIEAARLAATEDLPEAIGFIRSSTRKMDGLINAILKLSREGRRVLRPERIELDALLRAAADAVQHQVAEGEGQVVLDVQVPAIRSDRLALEQIFGNLLDNAVKYRQKGRPLEITIRGRQMPGNRVAIEVIDNGRGVAGQDLERIFELFRRSGAQDQPGEGIGLAFVRSVVRNLGGEITVASEFGKGTAFTVILPRALAIAPEGNAK